MSDLEMTVEALKRCVRADRFARAMEQVKADGQNTVGSDERECRREQVIRQLLLEVGVPTALKGYRYSVTAIALLMKDPSMADGITKVLYPKTAKLHDSTPSRVERAIRHGVECAFSRGDMDVLYGFFGNTVGGMSGKPTNSEFLTCLADIARDRLRG